VALPAKPRPGRDLSLPHLIGGEGALRQARVAKADLNFDDAVATNARAYGKRQAMEDELEIGDLQPFRRHRDLSVGSEPRGLKIGPESGLGVGGGDDENGSLNAKHLNLSSMNVPELRRRQGGLSFQAIEEIWSSDAHAVLVSGRMIPINPAGLTSVIMTGCTSKVDASEFLCRICLFLRSTRIVGSDQIED
jgi:hypothetical protein